MSVLTKVTNEDIYSFDNGEYQFRYTPSLGKVNFRKHCCVKVLTHFILLGFTIDESNKRTTNLDKGVIKVIPDIEGTEEETIARIDKTTSELRNESKNSRIQAQANLEAQCVNNSTGEKLRLASIQAQMRRLKAGKGADKLIAYLNLFNIELARPEDLPVMKPSSTGVGELYNMGFKYTKKLFEDGRLRKLTEEEYILKMKSAGAEEFIKYSN